ncbi:LOW QUALITY PROTEIN: Peptidase C19, ubiquitin carboxyl-terminal hydrolase [Dillenia turbinata]|uniref:Peptidase C19, ubiquitin carboxyl-terminal hydrolase n=1 Tax=Dillenia turbinata TaxID=194707 RepID=A0AAN8VUL2_9MAGN
MLVVGELGFSTLVLVVCFIFPVIGFIIRRKWRLAVARKEEIKRLLTLASEEAARAELEALFDYGYGGSSVSVVKHVRYVILRPLIVAVAAKPSGNCQIIHWRQGHKYDCHPPSIPVQFNGEGSDLGQKVVKQEEDELYSHGSEYEDKESAKPTESSLSSSRFAEVPALDNDEVKNKSISNSSSAAGQSLVDDSKNGINSSHVFVRSDGHWSSDAHLATSSDQRPRTQNKSASVSATVASSIDDFFSSTGDAQLVSSSSPTLSNLSSGECSVSEQSTNSSGFWGGTLESSSSSTKVDSLDDSGKFNISEAFDGCGPKSSLHYSFNLSGSATPPLHAVGSVASSDTAVNGDVTSFALKKAVANATSSEGNTRSVADVRSMPPINCEASNNVDSSSKSDILKSREVKSSSLIDSSAPQVFGSGGQFTDGLKAGSMPSLGSDVSSQANNDIDRDSHLSRSRQFKSSEHGTPFSSGEHLKSNTKSSNSNSVHVSAENRSSTIISSNGVKMSVKKVVDQLKPKGLCQYERFVKLYTWNKVELQPCGLTNCGNSCYANAVLQCLTFTPPLTAYLLQGLHAKECVKKEWCFTCEFERLILKAKEGRSPLSPTAILSPIQKIGGNLGSGRQEDSHEFLRYAVDMMQKEAERNGLGSLEEEATLVGLTFGGYLRSKIKCMRCHGKSEQHEKMMDLTVEIEGDIGNLEEALRKFTGTEILDGENKYHCSRCKSYEKAKKKLTVLEAPNSGKYGKLNKSIHFPEILDLAPYMSGTSDKSPIYRLYGVVVHLDVMNAAFSGHYVCYVKNIQNKWFKIDDGTVKPVELDRVLNQGAYMLLYARCLPRAPRSIRNALISREARIRKKQSEAVPSRSGGKNVSPKMRSHSIDASASRCMAHKKPDEAISGWSHFSGPARPKYEYADDLQFHHRPRGICEVESSSDNSSIFDTSDEAGSTGTDSTRDSTSTDDVTEYQFRDTTGGWHSAWRSMSDSETSSSSSGSSPSVLRHSPLADSDRYSSEADSYMTTLDSEVAWTRPVGGGSRREELEGKAGGPFMFSDTTKQLRHLVNSSSSSSSRETDSERLGRLNTFNRKSDVSLRRSVRERTD